MSRIQLIPTEPCNQYPSCTSTVEYVCKSCNLPLYFCSNHALQHVLSHNHNDIFQITLQLDHSSLGFLTSQATSIIKAMQSIEQNTITSTNILIASCTSNCKRILNICNTIIKIYEKFLIEVNLSPKIKEDLFEKIQNLTVDLNDFPFSKIPSEMISEYYYDIGQILISHDYIKVIEDPTFVKELAMGDEVVSFKHKFERFLHWLDEGNAKYQSVDFRFSKGKYPSLYAKKMIQKQEILIEIPKQLMITLENARKTEIGAKIANLRSNLNSPNHSLLAAFVLHEKANANSFWKPYLDILPDSLRNFPIFYTENEEKFLVGSPFLKKIREKRDSLSEDYLKICSEVPEMSKFSLVQYSEAMMWMSSRVFGCKINEISETALVPLIDLLNHSHPTPTAWDYNEQNHAFHLSAKEEIIADRQITYTCGSKCNSRFLLNYGIIVMENKRNQYQLSCKFELNGPMANEKKEFLNRIKFQSENIEVHVEENTENEEFIKLMNLIRFDAIENETEMEYFKLMINEGAGLFPNNMQAISLDNEKKALENLKEIALDTLQDYPTSRSEDDEILKKRLDLNQMNCVLLRQGEKKILEYLVRLADTVIPLLSFSYNIISQQPATFEFKNYIKTSIKLLKFLNDY